MLIPTERARLQLFLQVCLPALPVEQLLCALVHCAVMAHLAADLVIDIENSPGALAKVAVAASDAGVNLAAATCLGDGDRAELHILVKHPEAVRHLLAITALAVSREREVVVVEVEDRPGALADLTRRIAAAGINLDLVFVATGDRIVFGSPDLAALKSVLGVATQS